jgi:hypothetical protein
MAEKNGVGDAFAAALLQMLEEEPRRTKTAAAGELGVSRQQFHAYLKGKLPRRKTLNRAMHLWNLKLNLGAHSFDKEAFGDKEGKTRELGSNPAQLVFWQTLDAVSEKDLHVTMKRVGKVLRFDVRIEIPA